MPIQCKNALPLPKTKCGSKCLPNNFAKKEALRVFVSFQAIALYTIEMPKRISKIPKKRGKFLNLFESKTALGLLFHFF